jgi:YD repeat-containing protein
MSNRILSRAALLFLLVALAAQTTSVAALNGGQSPAQEQTKAQAERMIEGARKGATYDEAGRAVKTTVPTSENEKVNVSLNYDERNRVQSVVLGDGTHIDLVYNASGVWQGFSFPDGGKMLFKRNASGEIIGFTRVTKSARQQTHGANRMGVRRAGFGALTEDGCTTATASAVAAGVTAIAACLEGPSIPCATAVAAAAVAVAKAYEACKDKTVAFEESAA